MARSKAFALTRIDLHKPCGTNLARQFLGEPLFERRQRIDDIGIEEIQQRPPVPRNLSTVGRKDPVKRPAPTA
jgi:hypothetical protein